MGSTTSFGLTTVGPGESFASNNYKFSLRDRVTLDSLLWTLFHHDHSTTTETAVFAGPQNRPALTLNTTGGSLPGGQDLYYRISFRDAFGNETEASIQNTVSTPNPLNVPPSLTSSVASSGGLLGAGTYRYALAHIQGGGLSTRAPNITTVNVPSGTTNEITLNLNTPPEGATGWDVYRRDPLTDEYYYLDTVGVGNTTFVDDGSATLDCNRKRPTTNTTNSTNYVTIEIDPNDLPMNSRVAAWRIYRTSSAGVYSSNSLIADVTQTTTEGGSELVTSFVDIGITGSIGQPLDQTAVPPKLVGLDAATAFSSSTGRLPASAAPWGVHQMHTFAPGELTDSTVYNQTLLLGDMTPHRLEVTLLGAPVGADGSNHAIVRVKDDGEENEVQSLYNNAEEVNEIQRLQILASGGTFTLTFDSQTTDSMPWDVTAETLQEELENLSNIESVFVTKTGVQYFIEFLDPGNQNVAQMTVNSSLTGGSASVITTVAGSDGGTFTLTFDGDTTAAIAYDADASTLKSELEDLTSITTVNVTGAGTLNDPWVIEFVDPGGENVDILQANDTSLNGASFVSQVVRGHGNTAIELLIDDTGLHHAWTAISTASGTMEAESDDASVTTTGAEVSDGQASGGAAVELNAQNEYVEWNVGVLDPGDYLATFWVADVDATASFKIDVEDTNGPTSLIDATLTPGRPNYLPVYELEFTSTGAEDITLRVTKTDTGSDEVRVDKFAYSAFLDEFMAGSTLQVECEIVGSPTNAGENAQINLWY